MEYIGQSLQVVAIFRFVWDYLASPLLQRRLIVIGRKGNIFPGRDFSLQSVQFCADQGVGIQASNRCAGGLGGCDELQIAFAALTGLPGCLPRYPGAVCAADRIRRRSR